jgi:hypothetical protein
MKLQVQLELKLGFRTHVVLWADAHALSHEGHLRDDGVRSYQRVAVRWYDEAREHRDSGGLACTIMT